MRFGDLKQRLAERVVGEQSSTIKDTLAGSWVNAAISRLAREELWSDLRTWDRLTLTADYTTGTVAATNGTAAITGTSTVWTAAMVGRKLTFTGAGTSTVFRITAFTSATSITIKKDSDGTTNFDGTTGSGYSYTILSPEDYSLPYDFDRAGIFWHEINGYPSLLKRAPQRKFYEDVYDLSSSGTPERYRIWEGSAVLAQPAAASTISVVSSSGSDTSQTVRIYGVVSSYPDAENLVLSGATTITGAKSFSKISRVSISGNTANIGRITITDSTNSVTLAVIPVGGISETMKIRKIWLYPRSTNADLLNIFYYKRPFLLTDTNDTPDFGPEFDEAILLYGEFIGKRYQQRFDEATQAFAAYKEEVAKLRSMNNEPTDMKLTFQSRLNPRNAIESFNLRDRTQFPIPE